MDRYTKIREIGRGAYGKAILVEDNATKEKLVVKEMDMVKLPPESQEACRDEVKLLARLNHRNVVRYHRSFEERRKLMIVMEYCDGGDLEGKITPKNRFDPRLTENEIWSYFVQICLALKYIHGKKVLHRDLKPSNIFLTKKGEVKLGDFGVSRSLKYTMELATTFAGTPVYLSPEVVDSKPYNDKSDVWSLGCILYEMATGRLPFEVPNLIALCYQIMNAKHRPISSAYSEELRQLVDELLTKDPSHRPSISQILQKPYVRRHARKFLDDREFSKDAHVPRDPPVPAVEKKADLAHKGLPVDSMELYRARQLKQQQLAAAVPPVAAIPPIAAVLQYKPPERRNTPPSPRAAYGGAVPKEPPPQKPTTPPAANGPEIVVVPARPQHPHLFGDLHRLLPLFNLGQRPPQPPQPDRSKKPRVFGIFRRRQQPESPPKPGSPSSPGSQAPPDSAQDKPQGEKTLYQELLELGDDFDLNNLDLTGERFFKDEIDAQNQANKPEENDQQEEAPPSYDQLESRLKRRSSSPHECWHEEEDPSLSSTITPGETSPRGTNETVKAKSDVPLKEELLTLDYINPELDRFPDLQDDEGPDNFSTLFSLPEPGVDAKQMELYDELLAIELHNRELRLMGAKI